MDRTRIDELVTKFHNGELSRRGFIRQATALGLSAGAAGILAGSAGAQEASPAASPGASPSPGTPSPLVASPAAGRGASEEGKVASIAPPSRKEYLAALREEFDISDPEVTGGQVIYGQTTDLDTINLLISGDVYSNQVGNLIFMYVVDVSAIDGAFVPSLSLADTWDVAEDGLTYTFNLNPDAMWHDGEPVTADDVVFSFDITLDENTLSPRRSSVLEFLESYRAVDDHTVELVAKDRFATFLENTVALVAIMPKHIWQDVPAGDWGSDPGSTGQDPSRVVGCGPFTFVEWVPEDHVSLTKNEDFWLPELMPVIDDFTYRIIGEQASLTQALLAGEVDYCEITFADAPTFADNPDLNIRNYDTLGVNWFTPNEDPAKTELFTDIKVRQALMYALDRELMSEQVYNGYAIQANGTQPVLSVAYRPDEINTIYNYDPDKARQLLDEAGWTDTNDDGIREKDGTPFHFECLYSEGPAQYQQQLPYMQQAWAEIGIDMQPAAVPFTALLDATETGDYEMAVLGFNWSVDGGQLPMFGCEFLPPQGFNLMRYCNEEYDELSLQAEKALDPEERVNLLIQASNIVNDEQAAGYLMFRQDIAGSRQTLHNFYPNGYYFMWWIPFTWTEIQ